MKLQDDLLRCENCGNASFIKEQTYTIQKKKSFILSGPEYNYLSVPRNENIFKCSNCSKIVNIKESIN